MDFLALPQHHLRRCTRLCRSELHFSFDFLGAWIDEHNLARDPLCVFFAFQRYFVQGLLAGSVK